MKPIESHILFGKTVQLNWFAEIVLLGARLYAGITIAMAGLDKLPTPDWMAAQVTQMNFPMPEFFAFVACYTELVGGILLALGLLTPVVSFLLAFTLGCAAFLFHGVQPILGMHITQGFFWLYMVFIALGPGRLSIDQLICSLLFPGQDKQGNPKLGYSIAVLIAFIPASYGLYREFLYTPPPVVENNEELTIESISVPGSFNNWSTSEFMLAQDDADIWTGTFSFDEATPIQFKFMANESWDVNVGEADQSAESFPVSGVGEFDAGNIVAYIPDPGTYQFSINTETFDYSLELVEISETP